MSYSAVACVLRRALFVGLAVLAAQTAAVAVVAQESKPADAKGTDAPADELTPEQIEEMLREPPSHLAEMPALRLDSSKYEATVEERDEIARLIEELKEIDNPDYGMAPWMSGSQFAPVKSSQQFGAGIIMVDHGLKTAPALERLVALGPKALSALLDALSDVTPTKHKMEHGGGFGGMWYGREIAMNAANPRENKAKEAHAEFFKGDERFGGFDNNITEHAITRGDVCFLIIGQIVNRCYQPSRYQPTACLVINSPTHDPAIATIVREIWDSPDPAETLFKSLMTDFHSRGGAAGYQIGAAMRLLYYFPDESRDLLVRRLNAFDVSDIRGDAGWQEAWKKQMETNGDARPDEFIKAISFTDDPAITESLLGILRRTDDPDVFRECLSEATARANPDLVLNRMAEIIAIAPPVEQGPFGGEFYALKAAARFFPEKLRSLFDAYLKHDTLPTRRAAVHALNKPEARVPWAIDFLTPLLTDTTDTGWQYGPEYDREPIRVCDEAAEALTHHVEGATFTMEGETENLDRQIENIRRRIAGQPVVEIAAEKPAIDFDAVPRREPIASFRMPQQIGQIYDFSDQRTIYAGYGYQANCWAYDTIAIDVASGAQTSRTTFDEWNGGVTILRPQIGDHALCYHPYSGGDIIRRDIRTGKEVKRIKTPFKDGPSFDDPMTVRNLGDVAVSGDGRWLAAMTPDASLHTINLETGEHKVVWKREGESKFGGHLHGSLTPIQGTNRFIIEFFSEDDPLRIWDQDAGKIETLTKVPDGAWRSAWGKYAVNHLNNHIVLWDLEARKPLELPLPEGAMVSDLICDSDHSAILVAMADGTVWVIDLKSLSPRAKLQPPATAGRTGLTLSRDDRLLFWQADETNYDRKTGERSNPRTIIAVFDVAELTN
jgi:hypothetical protein